VEVRRGIFLWYREKKMLAWWRGVFAGVFEKSGVQNVVF
jgi:Leu/Phe-tRNA-protein transferase